MATDLVLGGPVRGDDFCFRAEFLDDLWDSLRKNNILLIGPRRMGKTSVMYHLLDHPRDDYVVVYLNTEALTSPADFILQLIFALKESQPSYFFEQLGMIWGLYKNLIRHSRASEFFEIRDVLRGELNWDEHWQDQASELFNGIKRINQKVIFMVDELPDMLLRIQKRSPEQFETFLHWFRIIRQTPDSCVQWLVAGSTNLIGTLDQTGHTKLINDFYHLDLPPFSFKEMENFALKVFSERGVEFDAEAIPRLQALLGKAIPYFLQFMLKELATWSRHNEGQILTKEVVDQIFDQILLGNRALGHLQHFHSRIEVYYPEMEREQAMDMLSFLSRAQGETLKALFSRYEGFEKKRPEPRPQRQLMQAFSRLMLLLQTDFYIEDQGGRVYDFSNRLLKLWWQKYYPPAS